MFIFSLKSYYLFFSVTILTLSHAPPFTFHIILRLPSWPFLLPWCPPFSISDCFMFPLILQNFLWLVSMHFLFLCVFNLISRFSVFSPCAPNFHSGKNGSCLCWGQCVFCLKKKKKRQFHLLKAVQFYDEKRQNSHKGASGIDSFWR